MERLLKDAEAYLATQGKTAKFSIDNLADVYTAINAIQQKLDIAGTTAKEAEKTISGSLAMMKAAWKNVVASIAGGGDIDRAINNLVYSVTRYFENIVPIVQRSIIGIGRLIEQLAPLIVQHVATALIQSIPNLINAIYQMIIGLAKGIWQGIQALFTGKTTELTTELTTTVNAVTKSTTEASTSINSLGDETEKTGKKIRKSLAAFDDLQILSSNISFDTAENNLGATNPNSSESTIPEITIPDIPPIEIDTTGVVDATNGLTEELSDSFKTFFNELPEKLPFSDNLKELINTVTESNIFQKIKDIDWEKIKTELKKLNPILKKGANFAKKIYDFLVNLVIDVQWDKIVDKIEEIDSAFTMLESFLRLDFKSTWNELAKIFGFKEFEDGKKKIDDANSAIETFNTTTDNFLDFWELNIPIWFRDYVVPYFTEDKWKNNLGNITTAIWKFFTGENGFLNTWNVQLGIWWDEKVNPWFTQVKWKELFENVPRALKDILTGAGGLAAVFVAAKDDMVEEAKKFFTLEYWEGIFENVKEAFDVIWDEKDGIVYKWRTGITSFWDDEVVPFFTEQKWKDLGTNIVTGLKDGILSLPNIMANAFNSVLDFAEDLTNGMVKAVNAFIDGYNSAASMLGLKKLNHWTGINLQDYKIDVPELATGTVVPPNREFLAVLGDNKKEHEIVSPISTMKQAFMEAMVELGGNFGGGNTTVVLELDGREFGRAVVEQGNKETRRIGTRLVIK